MMKQYAIIVAFLCLSAVASASIEESFEMDSPAGTSSLRGYDGEMDEGERRLWGWDFQNLMYHLGGCPDPDPASCCSATSPKKHGPLGCGCPDCSLPNASFKFCTQKEQICSSSGASSMSWDASAANDGGEVAQVPYCNQVQCISSAYGSGLCYCPSDNTEYVVACQDSSCSEDLVSRSPNYGTQGASRTMNWVLYIIGGTLVATMFAFALKKRSTKREIKGVQGSGDKKPLSDLSTINDDANVTVSDAADPTGAFEAGDDGHVAYANADNLEAAQATTQPPAQSKKPGRTFMSRLFRGRRA